MASARIDEFPVTLRWGVPRSRAEWELTEEPVPESELHDLILMLLQNILSTWSTRIGLSAHVARNRAVRWDPGNPRVGVDPDLAIITPKTPEGDALTSLMTWRQGHTAPLVAIEVVSENHPAKDYVMVPEKYAASGTKELWVFDPLLVGPKTGGGPFCLQLWARTPDGAFERIYAGPGPARSDAIAGWLVVVGGTRLRIADDVEGAQLWPTADELERTAKEVERAAKEEERAAKEEALARIAELEADLARRAGR